MNISLIKYRLATDSDFEDIYSIWLQGIKITFPNIAPPRNLKKAFRSNFKYRNTNFNFWVAESETIIGWCSILPIFSNPLKRETHGEVSTYINAEFTNYGIGQALMKFVFSKLENTQLEAVYGFANSNNKKSIQMCLSSGMKVCGSLTKLKKTILVREF